MKKRTSKANRSRTPTEGKLAISERAALLLPTAGAASVRIPYELVQSVDIRQSDGVGARRYMVVNSCFGRFYIVTFLPRQPNSPDPDAAMTVAAHSASGTV